MPRILRITAIIIALAALVGFTIFWYVNLPHWEIAMTNAEGGTHVQVFKSDEEVPTYEVLLDEKITDDVTRCSRTDLPPSIGTTLFFDETLKPGRWTLSIGGTTLDIMERDIIIDISSNE